MTLWTGVNKFNQKMRIM